MVYEPAYIFYGISFHWKKEKYYNKMVEKANKGHKKNDWFGFSVEITPSNPAENDNDFDYFFGVVIHKMDTVSVSLSSFNEKIEKVKKWFAKKGIKGAKLWILGSSDPEAEFE
jgi:hypothetical protein